MPVKTTVSVLQSKLISEEGASRMKEKITDSFHLTES